MMMPNEFYARFKTCEAKFNLIFAYHSSLPEDEFEKLDLNTFAMARNYADLCYLDMQRVMLMLYKEQDPEHLAVLEEKLNGLDAYLTQVLKTIDNLRK